jgi:hypothetical protein
MKISFVVPTGNVVKEARDKYLTSRMSACWHESTGGPVTKLGSTGYICTKCGMFYTVQNDFSMPEDFLKLYEWDKNDSSLEEFTKAFRPADFMNEKKGPHARKTFADGLFKILSAREEKKDVR